MKRLAAAAGCVAALHASIALACGSSDSEAVAAVIQPPASTVAPLMYADGYFDALRPVPFRFLEPIRLKTPACGEPLSKLAYEDLIAGSGEASLPDLAPIDTAAYEEAIRQGNLAVARREAQKLVDAILGEPGPIALKHGEQLAPVVEFLELAPHLGKVDRAKLAGYFLEGQRDLELVPPKVAAAAHRPSEALDALIARSRTEIGSGWPGQISDTDEKTWAGLLAGFDAWLAKYPRHPLADVARLRKLRVLYLKGDSRGAWNLLLGLYPQRPCRAIWEMRHLLLQEGKERNPTFVDPAQLEDLVLAASLVPYAAPLTREGWDQLWKRSEPVAKAAWGLNVQERLLGDAIRLAKDGPLPGAFPTQAAKPSELWAQLRTAALLAARSPDARAQAALLSTKDPQKDLYSALLVAEAHALAGDWVKAAEPEALQEGPVRYLLNALADDASLEKLSASRGPRAERAALALATRRLGDGAWEEGARVLQGVDPKRAAVWREAARRAKDDSGKGRLAFARWLAGAPLFEPVGTAYSRGLKVRLDAVMSAPSAASGVLVPEEPERLKQYLLRAGSRQRALEVYAEALAKLPPASKDAREGLAEADKLFNNLLSWDTSYTTQYEKLLRASAPAAALREAGKAIRRAR